MGSLDSNPVCYMSKTFLPISTLLCLTLISLVFSGCVAVTSDQLAGTPLSDTEYKAYEGSWQVDVVNDAGRAESGTAVVSVVDGPDGKKTREVVISGPDGDDDKFPFIITSIGRDEKRHFLWVDLARLEEQPDASSEVNRNIWTPIGIQKSSEKEGALTIRLLNTNKVIENMKLAPVEGMINLSPEDMEKLLMRDDVWIEGEPVLIQKISK
jgi:hypothetical protein